MKQWWWQRERAQTHSDKLLKYLSPQPELFIRNTVFFLYGLLNNLILLASIACLAFIPSGKQIIYQDAEN